MIQKIKKELSDSQKNQTIDEIIRNKTLLDGLVEDYEYANKYLVSHFMKPHIVRTFFEFKKLIEICQKHVSELNCRTLLVWGTIDQLVPKESIKYIFRKCKTDENEIKYIEYPNITHLALNSVNNLQILNDIEEFIKEED